MSKITEEKVIGWQNIVTGGVQYVPQIAMQYVYLDFDGEVTTYRNNDLDITLDVEVEDSGMSKEQKQYILAELSARYTLDDIVFTIEKPADMVEYSTIYIGQTDDFDKYGSFSGLAETIDKGNQIKNDNAFVAADTTGDLDTVVSVIAHEVDHIVYGKSHDIAVGDLSDFAKTYSKTFSSNVTFDASVEISYSSKYGFEEVRQRYYIDIPAGKYAAVTITYKSSSHLNTSLFFNANFNAQKKQINDKFGNSKTAYFLSGGLNTLNYVETYVETYPSSTIYYAGVSYSVSVSFYDRKYTTDLRINPGHGYDTRMFDKNFIQDNQSLTVCFTIFNYGDIAYDATNAYIYDDNKLLGTVAIKPGAAFDNLIGVKYSYTIEAGTLSAGIHDIRIAVAGASASYSSKISVTATPAPDLAITALTVNSNNIETTEVEVDQKLKVIFTVKNDGNATAKASKVYLYDGMQQIGVADVISLNANQEYTGSILFSASEFSIGQHSLELKCDALNQVTEAVEDNNSLNTPLTIEPLKPDWGIDIEDLSTKMFLSSDTVTVCLQITNHGKADAPAAQGVLRTKDREIKAFAIPSLKIGETQTVVCSFSASELPLGKSALFAEVNTGGLMEKSTVYNYDVTTVMTDNKAGDITLLNNGTFSIRGGDGLYQNYHDYVTVSDTSLELVTYLYNPSQYHTNYGKGEFYLDGELLTFGIMSPKNYFNIFSMAPGETCINLLSTDLSKPLTQGWHKLKCVLNPNNDILESNIDNNVFEFDFYVAGIGETIVTPDLKPYAYYDEPVILSHELGAVEDGEYFQAGKDIYVSFAAKNDNSLPLYSVYTLSLSVDGKVVNTWNGSMLKSSQVCDFVADYNLGKLSQGTHVVELNVNCGSYYCDADGNQFSIAPIEESNKNNNIFRKTITVCQADNRGDQHGIIWKNDQSPSCVIVITRDNYNHNMLVETSGTGIDFFALPTGDYQWSILDEQSMNAGTDITSNNKINAQKYVSDADNQMDIFFANANGFWESGFVAEHQGELNGWNGTKEQVTLIGKNKLVDIFEGSTDANILVLTDDANGDALFVDDIYTSLPGTVSEQQTRIAEIDEIRAGAGDDIVDMTSQRFEYIGDGVKIYGGLGNDIIWVNNGNNILLGDAGNDRIVGGSDDDVIVGGLGNDSMHGGGGNDIFCFGGDWGFDTIEQLASGNVTLWFVYGSERNWDTETMTYSDGVNSVTVCGVSEVTLKFGGDVSELPHNAFDDVASEKIYEDKNKGMLA